MKMQGHHRSINKIRENVLLGLDDLVLQLPFDCATLELDSSLGTSAATVSRLSTRQDKFFSISNPLLSCAGYLFTLTCRSSERLVYTDFSWNSLDRILIRNPCTFSSPVLDDNRAFKASMGSDLCVIANALAVAMGEDDCGQIDPAQWRIWLAGEAIAKCLHDGTHGHTNIQPGALEDVFLERTGVIVGCIESTALRYVL